MERPPMTRDSKKATIGLRATAAERETWERAARRDGRTLSAWIVRRCNGDPTTAPASSAQPGVETSAEPQRAGGTMTVDAPQRSSAATRRDARSWFQAAHPSARRRALAQVTRLIRATECY